MKNRHTPAKWTGWLIFTTLLCSASPAWAGYINLDTEVDVPESDIDEVDRNGPLRLEGTILVRNYERNPYEPPPPADTVRFSVADADGDTVEGTINAEKLEVISKEKTDRRTERTTAYAFEWRPAEQLAPDTRYEFSVEARREAHARPSWIDQGSGTFRTVGGETDEPAPPRADAGCASTSSGCTVSGPDTGISPDTGRGGNGSSADAGTTWDDAGSDDAPKASADGAAGCRQAGDAPPTSLLVVLAILVAIVAPRLAPPTRGS